MPSVCFKVTIYELSHRLGARKTSRQQKSRVKILALYWFQTEKKRNRNSRERPFSF